MDEIKKFITSYDLNYSNEYISIEVQNKYNELLYALKDYFVKSFSQSGSFNSPSDSQIKMLNKDIEDIASHIPEAYSSKNWDMIIDYASKCKEKQVQISSIVASIKDGSISSMEVPKMELQKKLSEVENYNLEDIKSVDILTIDCNDFKDKLYSMGVPREIANVIVEDTESKFDLKIAAYKTLVNAARVVINSSSDVYNLDPDTQTDYFLALGIIDYKDIYDYSNLNDANDKVRLQNIFTKYLNTHIISEEEVAFLKRQTEIPFLGGNTSFVISQMMQKNLVR